MAEAATVTVQVCHALPDAAYLEALTLPAGSTIAEALAASGIGAHLEARNLPIDLAQARVGIFGKLKTPDTLLRDGDRVELYRPLQADPKDSRRRRAKHREAEAKDARSRPSRG